MHQILAEFARLVGQVLARRWVRLQEEKHRTERPDSVRTNQPEQDTPIGKSKRKPRT